MAQRAALTLIQALAALALGGGGAALAADAVDAFLATHWQRPIPAQGEPPPGFTDLEASLQPEACGSCHTQQYADWSESLHSRAMGPGLLGQLVVMDPAAREQHQACLRCHAPLSEQADALVLQLQGDMAVAGTRPALHRRGLICAGCHVREHRRYGPPPRPGAMLPGSEGVPHGGYKPTQAFSDARFCSACHQFGADGYALNGKPLENTYEEWRTSRYAAAGVSCQQCHMPDRRHLWRGIHDPAMVRDGLHIEASADALSGPGLEARLRVKNTGAGHHFPTYVTPEVILEGEQLDATGQPIEGTARQYLIARQVPLDLSQEIADTRLPVDAVAELVYAAPRDRSARALRLQVRVAPDAYYTRFYTLLVEQGYAGTGEALLREALQASTASVYTLFEQRFPLP